MTCCVYSVADTGHFPGAVALVNSLRLAGHTGDIVVGDVGLAPEERDVLGAEADVQPVPRERSPHLLKTFLPLKGIADAMVLVDVDVIVLRPLDDVLAAWSAPVVAFRDPIPDRFSSGWGDLGLGPASPGAYLNSGFVGVRGEEGREILRLVDSVQDQLDPSANLRGRPADPFYYSDQDVWNAVLATGERRGRLQLLDARLAPHPPFAGLVERTGGRFAYGDGVQPFLLHHVLQKPWLAPTRTNAYSRLFPALTVAEGLPVRIDPERLPMRLRGGRLGGIAAGWAGVRALGRAQRGRLGVRRRLVRRAERRRSLREERTNGVLR